MAGKGYPRDHPRYWVEHARALSEQTGINYGNMHNMLMAAADKLSRRALPDAAIVYVTKRALDHREPDTSEHPYSLLCRLLDEDQGLVDLWLNS